MRFPFLYNTILFSSRMLAYLFTTVRDSVNFLAVARGLDIKPIVGWLMTDGSSVSFCA